MSYLRDAVWREIDEQDLCAFALDLGNTRAPAGYEEPLARRVAEWMNENGLPAALQEVYPERFNVVGRLAGTSGRAALLFNSHLDSDVGAPEDALAVEGEPDYDRAWQEGDR